MARPGLPVGSLALLLPALAVLPAPAETPPSTQSLCRLLLVEESRELADLELGVELARTQLRAAREISELLDNLWKNDAVERILYLEGRHRRDVAGLELELGQLRVERQRALVEQYGAYCERRGAEAGGPERHRRADCEIQKTLARIAGVDLEFYREVLSMVKDLRRNDVATKQDVIWAERDVAQAAERLRQRTERFEACDPSSAGESP